MLRRYSSLFIFFLAIWSAPAFGQAAQDLSLESPDGTTVEIDRDDFGVPHITGETAAAVFFGQGFAAAQDRLFQMETFWRTATGRLAEIAGGDALGQDQAIRTVYYTPEERMELFEELPEEVQTMMESYVAGINAYIDSTDANPTAYLPFEYTQFPLNQIGIEAWDLDKLVAVMQFFIRRFGEIGGQELTRLAELQANGEEWFNENRPVNEPEAPVTLHAGPPAPANQPVQWDGPFIDPAVAEQVERDREALDLSLDSFGVPRKFGSFAAVISGDLSATGNTMLLGAPQMGLPTQNAKAVTWESELLVGDVSAADLHVAGMTVPGIPGVIIGRTGQSAWTFTTGVTDNTDTYVELTDEAFQQYLYEGELQPFEVITETINVLGGDPVEYTHFRTVHGPVYAQDAENQQAFTYKYAFWERELEMASALYFMWEDGDLESFRAAAEQVPVSFNFFFTDKAQNIAYWHVGDYPIRPGDSDPRLPLLGDGSQEWLGFQPFGSHPQAVNPPQGYFVNWNNKPAAWWNQGDNVSWRMGAGRVYDGVTFLDAHLQESVPVSFEELQQLTCVVRANPEYQEYPGTYQQVVEFSEAGSYAENVIPPGESGFVNVNGVPSPNFADQWSFYQSSTGSCDEVEMKPFTFLGANPVANESGDLGRPGDAPALNAVYPNPAVGQAVRVEFELPASTEVRVEVFDVLGRSVAVLADGQLPAGPHAATVADALPSGVYLVRLVADGVTVTRKLTVVR